jgi:hypothetical protein
MDTDGSDEASVTRTPTEPNFPRACRLSRNPGPRIAVIRRHANRDCAYPLNLETRDAKRGDRPMKTPKEI